MNKQRKPGGGRGIEWTDYTWNPIAGCKHACRWQMPDGTTAVCYAETVAERVAGHAYPHGFAHHYWKPERLAEPRKVTKPARIFVDSMSDLFGAWVSEDEIGIVLGTCEDVPWHQFQILTKNAPRMLRFEIPANVWAGASMPPDHMLGHALNRSQQEKMLRRTLTTLSELDALTWMSFEPLSWDVSAIVAEYPGALGWAVIGAASNGPRTFQPDPEHVAALLDVLDAQQVPVFFKGNLRGNPAAALWREEFPR